MTENTGLVPLDTKELAEHRTQILTVQQKANDYAIASQEDVAIGEQMLRDIRFVEVGIDERKTEITRPLMKSLASVRDLFKPFELGLAEAKKTVKAKILAYQIEQDEIAKEAEAKLLARVEKGTMRADTASGKLEALAATKVKTNTRTLTKVRIVDETVIPREYLMPNLPLITEAILRKGVEIAGVEKFEEKVLVTK